MLSSVRNIMHEIAHRSIVTSLVITLISGGCSADRVAAPLPGSLSSAVPKPLADPVRLTVPTYDGSGQAVEPDVLHFAAPWHGWTYWMVMAPYPGGNGHMENPSILVSQDGHRWVVPPGVTNPLVEPPIDGINSDPALLYDQATDRLAITYREVSGGLNHIKGISSSDGITWSSPRTLFRVPQHGAVGQALTMSDGVHPVAWYVNSGPEGCAARSSQVERRVGTGPAAVGPSASHIDWSAPQAVTLTQPGFVIWHLDVVYIAERHEYWAVYPAYRPADGCGKCELFFARSPDGKVWTTYPGPFLRRSFSNWSEASLYRASALFAPSSDQLTVWLSARSKSGEWSLGLVQYRFTDFIRSLEQQRAG